MANQIQGISVKRIYLDAENPRHEALPDEASIIRHLIAHESVRNLAKDIAEAGSVSPLEPLAVIRHAKIKTAYTVVEGNRRVCALKLLMDPDKAGTEKDRRYFSNLASGMEKGISKVQAVEFESREAAIRWFSLRHRGEQDGVGTKSWDTHQLARFNLRTNTRDPNSQAVLLVEYAREHHLLTRQEVEALKANSITTLTRYLSNPVIRHALGLHDGNSIQVVVADQEFHRALTRFLRDSLSPETSGVSSRTKVADRKAYASKLTQDGAAATGHSATPRMPGTDIHPNGEAVPPSASSNPSLPSPTGDAAVAAGTGSGGTARSNQHPDKRRKVIPATFRVRIQDKALRRMYQELRDLDATVFTFAATALFRSVLEKSTALYLISAGKQPDQKLGEKLKQLNMALSEGGMSHRDLKFLRSISTDGGKDSPWSPDTLGHYIHGGSVPTPSYIFRYWDNMEHVFRHTLSRV